MDKEERKDLILKKANIGVWVIEMDEGCPPRMLTDVSMNELLGITEKLTPEETYEVWVNHIHPDYYDTVSEGVDKMIAGKHAEVLYPWLHPTRGTIYVRCGGVRDNTYARGICLQGTHQDVSNILKYHKDELTGLYTKEYFFQRVEEILAENPDRDYRILVSDIENFKMINEKYGVETGDELLKYLAHAVKELMPDNYIIGARLNADKFACLQRGESQTREEGQRIEATVLQNAPVPNLIWKHGIYYTKFDRSLSVRAMCDRARLAVDSIKGVYGIFSAEAQSAHGQDRGSGGFGPLDTSGDRLYESGVVYPAV